MLKSIWFKIGFCIFLYILFLVYNAPARLISTPIAQYAPQVSITQYNGTVWQGCGQQSGVTVNNAYLYIGDICWQIDFSSFLDLEPTILLTTQAASHNLYGEVSVAPSGLVNVSNLSINFPLALLEPWVPLLVSGQMAVNIDTLELTPQQVTDVVGDLALTNVVWLGADDDMVLGDYSAELIFLENQDLRVDVIDQDAALGIQGDVTLSKLGRYKAEVELFPRDGLAPEITNSLRFFGKRNAVGNIVVKDSGTWR